MRELHPAPDLVVDHRGAALGDAEAQRPARSGLQAPIPAEPVVAEVGVVAALLHLLAGAVAVVGQAFFEQALGGLGVLGGVVGLEVGALVLDVVHAQPGHGSQNALGPLWAGAGGVGVLDPQHHGPAGLSRDHPVQQQ